MPEDQHDNRGGHYDNQVSADSWLRGGGARGATGKPSFDRDNSWRRGRAGSLDWGILASDPAVIRQARTKQTVKGESHEHPRRRARIRTATADALQLEEQAATSDYNAHLYNRDDDAAGEAMMQVAEARNQRETLVQQYRAELERSTVSGPLCLARSSAQARQPNEMDQQDLADIMNTSRYSGKSFTAQDYDNLRRGLGWYKTSRGQEGQ